MRSCEICGGPVPRWKRRAVTCSERCKKAKQRGPVCRHCGHYEKHHEPSQGFERGTADPGEPQQAGWFK